MVRRRETKVYCLERSLSQCQLVHRESVREVDVHGSVHRNTNLIERTNKMQPCSRIYYSNVS